MTADELRAVVSKYWVIDDIKPARIYAYFPDGIAEAPGAPRFNVEVEPNGRKWVAAWLFQHTWAD